MKTKITQLNYHGQTLLGLLLILALNACDSKFIHEVIKEDKGLTIKHDSLELKIEIVDEAIVHVTKQMPGAAVSNVPDYVTVLEPQDIKWTIEEIKDQLTITTDQIKVLVNSDGTIQYEDKNGKPLLSETNDNTYLNPTADGNVLSQAFVAGEEALYGLGQFQSGIMNWKNVPIRLQQYNQEIAIPFLVSTKGYGIYWNNYSLTDFNEPQNEIEFDAVAKAQISKENEEVPTTGEKENVAAYATVEAEEKNIRSITFTPDQTGEYTFLALSDNNGRMRGEIQVTIDGDEVINYSTIWMPRRYSGKKYLEAGRTYEVVFQNTGAKMPGRLFYNKPDFNKTVFSSQAGDAIDYYFVQGQNPGEVVSQYQKLTGRAPMFSKAAYGFWQCRERYHDQVEILENAREMRERKIPVDYIVQDWFYWPKGEKGPEWDRAKYPDPKAMIDEISELNMRLMVSVWPHVENKALIEKYNLTKIEGTGHVDVYDTEMMERYYRMLSDSMFQIGVKSIWLDGSESPGAAIPEVITGAGPHDQLFNAYSLELTRAMYEGRRKEFPDERVFNLTRSAYAGQQRYGATSWSGDTEASWEQFEEQIAAGLNFTMAGVPYWTHDIGGFFRDAKSINPYFDDQYTNPEFIELLTRWFQFGAFSPIFRIHGYVSETEIWRYNEAFESTARRFIDLRYQLMPYIYSQAWRVTREGRELMSPLAYHYPEDKKTWEIKDQFFFGESIMVGLVTEYEQREKDIYLPAGDWYNYWTGEKLPGGQTVTVDAPLDQTPLFVKAGSIIPFGPKVQYATQETDEPLTIKIYPGEDAEYVLYLDDNESYDYEQGEYSELVFAYDQADQSLTIENGNGDYIDFEQNPMDMMVEVVGDGDLKKIQYKGRKVEL